MKQFILFMLISVFVTNGASASNIIPVGNSNNTLYYKMGGASDFALPPVSSTNTVRLNSSSNLGVGYSCSAFNPALSISNSMNDIKNSADNLEQSLISNATGSLIQLPMYLLAQANPTAYNLLNNKLLSAHNELSASTKSCDTVKDQISQGKNPYQDWGTIAINDDWKKHLSFVSSGNEDINQSKKMIDAHGGENGVPWVQGSSDANAILHAGGKSQPPIHVIADTTKSGYNALLNRDLQSNLDAPNNAENSGLKKYFPNPAAASAWITNVVGDQIITTCNDNTCKKQQGGVIGHGLLPWVTSCQMDKDNCSDTIRDDIGNLVTGNTAISKNSLTKVSADGIAISPEVIASIRDMDSIQQKIIINKLAQEIAVQRVMDKAFIARNILATGAQVPVIAANHPAQVIIAQAMTNLDNDIRSLSFESQIRKQNMSATIAETLTFSNQQQRNMTGVSPASTSNLLMENGALQKGTSS